MKTNNLKNIPLNDSLASSPYFKNVDKKKKRKKNSYTDKFIDKKKLSIYFVSTGKTKKEKRNITSLKKETRKIIDKNNKNEITKSDNKSIDIKNNKIINNNKNYINQQKLTKNYRCQNFNIKFQFLPKNKQKFISSEDSNINREKIKSDNNTNTNNLNSNIILINNNNINYINKNENEEKIKGGQNINIILNDKIQNINKDEELNIIGKREKDIPNNHRFKNIIIDNNNRQILTNEEIFQNEKVKSLLITNISDITNNISNIYSNTDQSVNSNNKNIIHSKNNINNSNSKINEYCFKNKNPNNNFINNFNNDNTY